MRNAKALLNATQGYPVKPVVLLLEDLDQMLQGDHSHNEERNMVNSLLSGIQDLKENPSVLVVGTGSTDAKGLGQRLNRNMHTLFQQVIDIPEPDEASRQEILSGMLSHQRNLFASDIDTDALAKKTVGLCHHDFVDILEEAKNHANQRRRTELASSPAALSVPMETFRVSMADMMSAIEKRLAQKHPQDDRPKSMYI
jgi:SpoVK/Ycf46/Vps4 family AAA+-type ATPase